MIVFLFLVIGLCLLTAILFMWLSTQKAAPRDDAIRITTIIFAVWLISGAVFGPSFFAFRVPGLFDITIERMLFSLILILTIWGLFSGQVNVHTSLSIEFWMFLFSLVCIASMIQNGFVSPQPDLYPAPWFVFITGYLFPFVIFIFSKHFVLNEIDQIFVFHALFYFSIYLVIISFFEFFQMRQYVYPQYINDPTQLLHIGRARGPFMNAALNGVAIVIGFVAGVHLLSLKKGAARILHSILLLLYFPAIFFTQTRSVYLIFLIALAGILFFYRTAFPKWKLLALPLAIVLIFASLQAPRLLSSNRRAGGVLQVREITVRFELLRRSFAIFFDNPIFGIGLAKFIPTSVQKYRGRGAVAEAADYETQHNHLVGLTVEIGIIGIAVYLTIYALIFRRFMILRGWLKQTDFSDNNLLLIGGLIWIIYLTNNMFVEPGYFIFINSVPFMMAGMADGMYNRYILGTR